jgi:subtilisin family serine protease
LLSIFIALCLLGAHFCPASAVTVNAVSYNDADYSEQWWIANMNLTSAWEYDGYSTEPVVIAVIDTGIDHSQPELLGHIWTNAKEIPDNGIDDDNNGYVDDVHGWDFYNNDNTLYNHVGTNDNARADSFDNDDHGTHIAGILAASGNNGIGIVGITAPINAKIMCIKAFGGVNGNSTMDKLVDAIHYAEDNGASIVNVSWNLSQSSEELKNAIAESNMLFVCSAGNGSNNLAKHLSYPCCYRLDNVISVTALNEKNNFCSAFANYSPDYVQLAAPGKNIKSCVIGGYRTVSGTSMAVPMVSGTAALMKAANPSLSACELKQLLCDSAARNAKLAKRVQASRQLNSAKAVQMAATFTHTADTKAPAIRITTKNKNGCVVCKIKVTDAGGSGLRLIRYAYGKRTTAYFKKGAGGKRISSKSTLTIRKNRKLTVYALDRDGNETISTTTVTLSKK